MPLSPTFFLVQEIRGDGVGELKTGKDVMSSGDLNYGSYERPKRNLTKRQAFEAKLAAPFVASFSVGSTFAVLPELFVDKMGLLEISWLWFHFGLYKRDRY